MAVVAVAASKGIVIPMQVTQSALGAGAVLAIPVSFKDHNFLIRGSAGVASGAVLIETSNDPNDAGLWAPVAAAVTVLASTDLLVAYKGVLNFVRARISTVLVGGTVSVDYYGG